jgi:hypothetical protein
MKTLFIICSIFSTLTLRAWAQDPAGESQPGDGSRLEALKIAYITKKLDLTSEEAQRFWPIYNSYMKEIRSARQSYQVDKDEIKLEENVLAVRKKYSGDFNKALSPAKVNMFFRSEKEFGAFVQKELRERRQQQRMAPRRPLLR